MLLTCNGLKMAKWPYCIVWMVIHYFEHYLFAGAAAFIGEEIESRLDDYLLAYNVSLVGTCFALEHHCKREKKSIYSHASMLPFVRLFM